MKAMPRRSASCESLRVPPLALILVALSVAVMPAAADGPRVLFSDNFSEENANWDIKADDVDWEDGELAFEFEDDDHRIRLKRPIPLENVSVEFRAECGDDGLILRWTNAAGGGYGAVLGVDERSALLAGSPPRKVKGTEGDLCDGDWQVFQVVREGDRLAAYCDGKVVLRATVRGRLAGTGHVTLTGGDDAEYKMSRFTVRRLAGALVAEPDPRDPPPPPVIPEDDDDADEDADDKDDEDGDGDAGVVRPVPDGAVRLGRVARDHGMMELIWTADGQAIVGPDAGGDGWLRLDALTGEVRPLRPDLDLELCHPVRARRGELWIWRQADGGRTFESIELTAGRPRLLARAEHGPGELAFDVRPVGDDVHLLKRRTLHDNSQRLFIRRELGAWEPLPDMPPDTRFVAISPDWTHLAVREAGRGAAPPIEVYANQGARRLCVLPDEVASASEAVFSPSGDCVALANYETAAGVPGLAVIEVAAPLRIRVIHRGADWYHGPAWSPDGRYLAASIMRDPPEAEPRAARTLATYVWKVPRTAGEAEDALAARLDAAQDRYETAYAHLVDLHERGITSGPEANAAYEEFVEAKAAYEAVLAEKERAEAGE